MVNFFLSSCFASTCFSSAFVEAAAFSAASSVKVASSRADVFSTADGSVREVLKSSSFFNSDNDGDWADFLESSLARGFFASLISKRGGGPGSLPWVVVSVA